MDLIEVLGFLFMLSTMVLGRVRYCQTFSSVFAVFHGVLAGLFDRKSRRYAKGDARRFERLRPHLAA